MLSAERLLGGALEQLLRDTDGAYKDVTDRLYVDYRLLREKLIDFIVNSADGPRLPALAAIEPAQKILDRILFIAFAQRTDLLPDRLLERAAISQNEFNPKPIWHNFSALFRAVDQGRHSAQRLALQRRAVRRRCDRGCDRIARRARGRSREPRNWDYRREVPVTLLGHIFEQSITDIERLKAASSDKPARHKQAQARGRRLYAGHGHALSRREDHRRFAARCFRRAFAAPRHGRGRERSVAARVLARLPRSTARFHDRRSCLRFRRFPGRGVRLARGRICPRRQGAGGARREDRFRHIRRNRRQEPAWRRPQRRNRSRSRGFRYG